MLLASFFDHAFGWTLDRSRFVHWMRAGSMLDVYFSVDVELWPESWVDYRRSMARSYQRYIVGATPKGDYGLQFQLELARDHRLDFVFFVESLFSCEGGLGPLTDIVSSIKESNQDIQLHAHPEWVAHMQKPFVAADGRYTFHQFTLDEQIELIRKARENLMMAGAGSPTAFRAGGFAGDESTLRAVSQNRIPIDSSLVQGCSVFTKLGRLSSFADVFEYPLTVFRDWPGHRRQLQLGACSYNEIVHVLTRAHADRWPFVVLLSHSAELLNSGRSRPNRVVVRRFERLCRFLAEHRNDFATRRFDRSPRVEPVVPERLVRSGPARTVARMAEQLIGELLR